MDSPPVMLDSTIFIAHLSKQPNAPGRACQPQNAIWPSLASEPCTKPQAAAATPLGHGRAGDTPVVCPHFFDHDYRGR